MPRRFMDYLKGEVIDEEVYKRALWHDISEYIRQMESTAFDKRLYVYSWENDYKQLKHIRWVRNQLAHEVGTLTSGICTLEDLEWVKSFHERIICGTDPFTIIRKKEKAAEERRAEQRAQAGKQSPPAPLTPEPQKTSFWDKFVSKIKEFFT